MSPDLLTNAGLGAVVVLAGVANWWKTRRAEQAAKTVRDTLTTENGGSHVRDQLNRIENTGEATAEKLDALELRVERLERRPRFPFLPILTLWRIR